MHYLKSLRTTHIWKRIDGFQRVLGGIRTHDLANFIFREFADSGRIYVFSGAYDLANFIFREFADSR